MASVSSRESLQLARKYALEVVQNRGYDFLAAMSQITMDALDCALTAKPFESKALEHFAEKITVKHRAADMTKFAFAFSMLMKKMSGSIIGSEKSTEYTGSSDLPSTSNDANPEETEKEEGVIDEAAERSKWLQQQLRQQLDRQRGQFQPRKPKEKKKKEDEKEGGATKRPVQVAPSNLFYCGACQSGVEDIETHEETCHTKIWLKHGRKCPAAECDYRAIHGDAVCNHVKNSHNGTDHNYQFAEGTTCPYCKTTLSNLAELISHMNEHREMWTSQVPIYICSSCGFACARVYLMIQHWNERLGACTLGLQFDYTAAAEICDRAAAAAAAEKQIKKEQKAEAQVVAAELRQQQHAAAAELQQQQHAAAVAAELKLHQEMEQKARAAAAAEAAVEAVVFSLQIQRELQAVGVAADDADEPHGSAKRSKLVQMDDIE